MWLLNSLLCLVCTGNVDTSQYEAQFPTADPVHFHPFISNGFLFFFVTHLLLSFDPSRTIFQQMPDVFFFFSVCLLLPVSLAVDSSTSLFLSPGLYSLSFSSQTSSLFLLYTLPVFSDQTRIPPDQPVSSLRPGHRSDQRGNGTGTKRNQLKRTRNLATLLVVAVGVGVLMGCDRIDIGFGYSPASRFQEFRCRYGYAFHVIFWSQNMDPNSYMDSFLHADSSFQPPVSGVVHVDTQPAW